MEKWERLGLVLPFDVMKFRLTYDGQLVTSGGNSGGRVADKWAIRKKIYPQLVELWQTHPVLKGIGITAHPKPPPLRPIPITIASPDQAALTRLLEPITVGNRNFVPLVRESLKLACGLDILFLRKEQPGSLVLQGGDIDNRLKTLFDALRVPSAGDLEVEQPDVAHDPFYCLLEQDALITSFSIETDRLLAKPDTPVNQVYLVIEVTVKVMTITEANVGFLGD